VRKESSKKKNEMVMEVPRKRVLKVKKQVQSEKKIKLKVPRRAGIV
jgi:hypothetical protein